MAIELQKTKPDGLSVLTSREASILAISLAAVGISLGSLSLSNSPTLGEYLFGYYSAWFGLAFREMSILQTSLEGFMKRDGRKGRAIRTIRFLRPLGIRIAQVVPMILWITTLQSLPVFHFLAALVIIILAIGLNIIEYFFLWID